MKKELYIFFSLFFCLLIYLTGTSIESPEYINLVEMGGLGCALLLFSLWSWKVVQGSLLSPYIFFLLAAYIFTFGQSILYVFNVEITFFNLLSQFTYREIFSAQYITLLFLGFFHTGALFSVKVRGLDNQEVSYEWQRSGIKKIGFFFFYISIVPFLIEAAKKIQIVLTSGYGGLYLVEANIGINNILPILATYMMPSLICLYVAFSNQKQTRIIITFFLILYIGYTMFLGGRTSGVITFGIICLLYNHFDKPVKFKQSIIIVALVFSLLTVISVVGSLRSSTERSLNTYSKTFNEQSIDNAVVTTISEMGGSMYPLASTMRLVPKSYPYRYGATYLYSLTSVIPNLGFWEIHPAMKNANLGDWLQEVNSLGYGPGYSLVAEAYINFGVWGFLMMFLMGYIFSGIFQNYSLRNRNTLSVLLSVLLCFLILSIVRNSFLSTVRSLFFYILPIYLYVTYFSKKRLQ